MLQPASKVCFVIAPIGEEESETRRRSDQVFNHIITPALDELGYQTLRADKLPKPGMITTHIIDHLLNDDLVVADLTGRNPNVFYELAVRHAVKKPSIHIIDISETPPFDIAGMRYIAFNHRDLDSAAKCRSDIREYAVSTLNDPNVTDSPISIAISVQELHHSSNPYGTVTTEIMGSLQNIQQQITILSESMVNIRQERPLDPAAVKSLDLALTALYLFCAEISTFKSEDLNKVSRYGNEFVELFRSFLSRIGQIEFAEQAVNIHAILNSMSSRPLG